MRVNQHETDISSQDKFFLYVDSCNIYGYVKPLPYNTNCSTKRSFRLLFVYLNDVISILASVGNDRLSRFNHDCQKWELKIPHFFSCGCTSPKRSLEGSGTCISVPLSVCPSIYFYGVVSVCLSVCLSTLSPSYFLLYLKYACHTGSHSEPVHQREHH